MQSEQHFFTPAGSPESKTTEGAFAGVVMTDSNTELVQLLTSATTSTAIQGNAQPMESEAELSSAQSLQSVSLTTELTPKTSEVIVCCQCKQKILDRYLLKAMEMFWHEDCLKCNCCQCRLAEAGDTLYVKQGMHLCKRDYLRLFGLTGLCAACHKSIPAFEMVMRARNNVYHLECFACQECNHRFCVGDRFYLCDNKILCEYDYEERMVFAHMAYNYNGLAHLKRQFQQTDDMEEVSAAFNGNHPLSIVDASETDWL